MSRVNPRVPRSGASIAELLLRAAVRRYFLSLCSGRKVAGHAFAVSHIGSFCWFSLVLLLVLWWLGSRPALLILLKTNMGKTEVLGEAREGIDMWKGTRLYKEAVFPFWQ